MLDRSLIAVTDVLATTPGVMFCVKSTDGVYLYANLAFAERAGQKSPGDVVGKTAREIFPAEIAENFEEQDAEILATGRMLTNELEVITRPGGDIGWFLTSKSRWTDAEGVPVGIVNVSVDLRSSVNDTSLHGSLARAVDVVRGGYARHVTVAEMAAAADLTTSQLERLSNRVLGISPKQIIMRFRLEEALRLLGTTDKSLAEISAECGYYDQSDFTRHFRRAVGWSPAGWRSLTRA